jgi:hygromycin-B 4-O-kinase
VQFALDNSFEKIYNKNMKTTFSEKQIIQIIRKLYPDAVNINNMIEGDTSQTYCFDTENAKLVIQTGRDLQGYKKEAYIYKTFHNIINVRNVLRIDKVENDIYFCITEFINAERLQDLNSNELIKILEYIMNIFNILKKIDITGNTGFGYFNCKGIAQYKTWAEFIKAVYNEYQWGAINKETKELVLNCISEIKKYDNLLDNEKSLIHGDFGSSNVLNNDDKIYLIDWSLSLYGDPLYDIANVLFWNEECLGPLISCINKRYLKDERTIRKIYIYILRIGLEEIYRTLEQKQNGYNNKWVENRTEEVINTFLKNS